MAASYLDGTVEAAAAALLPMPVLEAAAVRARAQRYVQTGTFTDRSGYRRPVAVLTDPAVADGNCAQASWDALERGPE